MFESWGGGGRIGIDDHLPDPVEEADAPESRDAGRGDEVAECRADDDVGRVVRSEEDACDGDERGEDPCERAEWWVESGEPDAHDDGIDDMGGGHGPECGVGVRPELPRVSDADLWGEGVGSEGAEEVEVRVGFEHALTGARAAREHLEWEGGSGGEYECERVVEEASGVVFVEEEDEGDREDDHATLAVFTEPAEDPAGIASDCGVSGSAGDEAVEGEEQGCGEGGDDEGASPWACVGKARPDPDGRDETREGREHAVRGTHRGRETPVIVAEHA